MSVTQVCDVIASLLLAVRGQQETCGVHIYYFFLNKGLFMNIEN